MEEGRSKFSPSKIAPSSPQTGRLYPELVSPPRQLIVSGRPVANGMGNSPYVVTGAPQTEDQPVVQDQRNYEAQMAQYGMMRQSVAQVNNAADKKKKKKRRGSEKRSDSTEFRAAAIIQQPQFDPATNMTSMQAFAQPGRVAPSRLSQQQSPSQTGDFVFHDTSVRDSPRRSENRRDSPRRSQNRGRSSERTRSSSRRYSTE